MQEVKAAGRWADLQSLPEHLPAPTAAKGFSRLCPAATLLACSPANQRLTLQPVTSEIPSPMKQETDMALSESHSAAGAHTHPAEHHIVALRLHRHSGCPQDLS